MLTFERVGLESKHELTDLLKVCFGERDEINISFINYCLRHNKCLAVNQDGKIISALYLIDSYVVKGRTLKPVYYIYAAGTHPNFRRNGVMSLLLDYANDFASKQKRDFTFLLPSNEKNYLYYEKSGYENYFYIRTVDLSGKELNKLFAKSKTYKDKKLSYRKMSRIRRAAFHNDGDVVWPSCHIKFAQTFLKICDMEIVYASNGYAICIENENNIQVRELAVYNDEYDEIMGNLLRRYDCESYSFDLPCCSTLFSGVGRIKKFGMIRPTSESVNVFNVQYPYLGIPLD